MSFCGRSIAHAASSVSGRRGRRICLLIGVALLAGAGAMAQVSGTPAASAPAGGSPQSIWDVIVQGMAWPAYFILVGSVAALALIVEHFVTTRRVTIAPPLQVRKARDLIEKRMFRECLDGLKKSSTFFARVMTASMNHARNGFDAMHEAAIEKSGELSGQHFRKVEYLNLLGNLGPLMGLLGTVFGMIIAFGGMAQPSGDAAAGADAGADAASLARGISLALVNTLLGLGLAIIGLLFFGICRNRIDALTVQATVQVLDLLEYFRPVPGLATSTAPPAATEPRRAAPPPPPRVAAPQET